MAFGYLFKEIQVSKVSTLVLKLVYFENDNFLYKTEILKNCGKNIHLACLQKFRRGCSC